MLLPTCACMDAVIKNASNKTCNVVLTKGVQETKNDVSIVVYPNPTSQTVMINTHSNYTGKPYSRIDYSGKLVLTGIIANGTTTVNTNDLPAGNYYLQILDEKRALSIIK